MLEPEIAIPPALLGMIHRDVGVMKEQLVVSVEGMFGRSDADRCGDIGVRPVDIDRPGDLFDNSSGQPVNLVGVTRIIFDCAGKFVTAKASEQRAIGQNITKAPCNLHQHAVAGLVAADVIYLLEFVQIQHQRGNGPSARTGIGDQFAGSATDPATIQAAGQGVRLCKLNCLIFRAAAFAHFALQFIVPAPAKNDESDVQ